MFPVMSGSKECEEDITGEYSLDNCCECDKLRRKQPCPAEQRLRNSCDCDIVINTDVESPFAVNYIYQVNMTVR